MFERKNALGVAVSLICLVFLIGIIGESLPTVSRTVTEALIYGIIVVGLGVFIGNTGIVSFGHVAFGMIGAYAAGWTTCCTGIRQVFLPGLPDWLAAITLPLPVASVLALVLVAIVAAVTGAVLLRLNGTAAAIGFMSLLFMVKTIYENWDGWTGGQSALVGLPLVVTPLAAASGLALAVALAAAYASSTSGLLVRAARDDEVAAMASGVRVWSERLICLLVSAIIVGLGGILFAHNIGSISVNLFWLDMTFLTLAMLVIGGRSSLSGAVLGALIVTLLRDGLRLLERGVETPIGMINLPEGNQEISLAIMLLLVLTLRPAGLIGSSELNLFSRFRDRASLHSTHEGG